MSATLIAIPGLSSAADPESGDPLLFKRMKTWWLVLALLLLVDQASIFTVASGQGKSLTHLTQYYSTSAPLLLLSTLTLWGIAGAMMLGRLAPTLRLMSRQKYILSFVILAFLSLLWSQDPGQTFRKGMWLLLLMLFAWFVTSSYTPQDQMRLFLVVGMIIALSSCAMAILLPRYGLDSGGQWKGVFGQKNQLGQAILFLFSCLAFRPIQSSRRLWIVILQATLALGLIVMSRSAGSLILAVLLVAVRWYGPFLKSRRPSQLPFLIFSTIVVILGVVFAREIVFMLLGRDSTLTGRTREWAVLSYYAARHVWLGYGYAAFWTGTGDSIDAMKAVGGAMRGADSGYFDTFLQFGIAGVVLWLVAMQATVRDFLRLLKRDYVPMTAYWYAGVILATFVGSVTDGFFPGSSFATFIFVVACAGLRNFAGQSAAPAIRASFEPGSSAAQLRA